VLAFFREAKEAPRLEDPEEVDRRYRKLRVQALLGSMVAYALFYLLRNNLAVAIPLMIDDLHYTKTDLGKLTSTIYWVYAVSKLTSGLVADRSSPRAFMVTGLLLAALANCFFARASYLGLFMAIWAMNGVFQSLGAPPCAKVLATWFGASERGTKTGIWNISHQAGGGFAVALAGWFAASYGWQGCFLGPALVVVVLLLVVAPFLHDRPESHGLPPVEYHRNEETSLEDDARNEPFLRLLVSKVLLNRTLWLVALASGFTHFVRLGAIVWSPTYLNKVRHLDIASAGLSASLLEFLGVPGALLCGWLTDRFFRARRAPVVFVSLLGLSVSIALLVRVPENHPYLDAALIAAMGFFTYGPQLLLAGVAPVDMSSKRVAAAAVGFTGFVSYVGAALSTQYTGKLVDDYGWVTAFDCWAVAAAVGAALCLPLWNHAGGRKTA
jgi:sugar phosphate permease